MLGFVARRAHGLIEAEGLADLSIAPLWLAAATLCYALALLPAAVMWKRMLALWRSDIPLIESFRAYYASQVAKYVPGKAMMVIVRATLAHRAGARLLPAMVATVYETAMLMGVGAAVAFLLFPEPLAALVEGPIVAKARESILLRAALLAIVALAVLPLFGKMLSGIALRMMPLISRDENESPVVLSAPPGEMFASVALCTLLWAGLGFSLLLTARSVTGLEISFENWLSMTESCATAVFLGFLAVFTPGGLGVREGVLIESLRLMPDTSAAAAVAVPVLFRLVSIAGELLAALGLWFGLAKMSRVGSGG